MPESMLEELSVGATPTLRFSVGQRGLTELRPGNYVYFDRTQVALGAATLDDCALTVVATVVSKPAADRIILDCGSKTLTNDPARGITSVTGFGAVIQADADAPPQIDESLTIERLSEEHATVRVTGGNLAHARRPCPGRAQPLMRRFESRRCRAARRRQPRRRRRCRSLRGERFSED